MADLKCSVDNCTYNEQQLCRRGDILVGGKNADCCGGTCCESFAQRREERDSFQNSTCHASKTVNIDCEAEKCVYNSDYKCTAGHVDIQGCGACNCKGTTCATFAER